MNDAMTVRELIEKLSALDPDWRVGVVVYTGPDELSSTDVCGVRVEMPWRTRVLIETVETAELPGA